MNKPKFILASLTQESLVFNIIESAQSFPVAPPLHWSGFVACTLF